MENSYTTNENKRTDVEKYRYLAALSYVCPIGIFLMLMLDKDSNYIRHHANQAVCLVLWFAVCGLAMIIPLLGWIAGGIGMVAGVVFAIIAVVRTLKREYYQIPVIGKYRIIPEA
ncbi:MAG: DUF4870 domain-containing protein [Clostridia bacterium]|nr:DUF4870 domain-containing protein [Clostridia bacterium]